MPRARAGPTVRLVRDELDQVPVRGLEIQLLPDTLGASPVVTGAGDAATALGADVELAGRNLVQRGRQPAVDR